MNGPVESRDRGDPQISLRIAGRAGEIRTAHARVCDAFVPSRAEFGLGGTAKQLRVIRAGAVVFQVDLERDVETWQRGAFPLLAGDDIAVDVLLREAEWTGSIFGSLAPGTERRTPWPW